jgi:hypothetical protein
MAGFWLAIFWFGFTNRNSLLCRRVNDSILMRKENEEQIQKSILLISLAQGVEMDICKTKRRAGSPPTIVNE